MFQLDMPVPDDIDTTELNDFELSLLGGKSFVGESILRAPSLSFEGLDWEVVLGVVNQLVYKISLQYTGERAKAGHFNRFFGIRCNKDYTSGPHIQGVQIWDARNGNICVDSHNLGSEAVVTVTLTSSQVSRFVPNI